jgi:hypothetical protein
MRLCLIYFSLILTIWTEPLSVIGRTRGKKRITGLLHKPDQPPAHSLIDLAFHIVETGALTSLGRRSVTSVRWKFNPSGSRSKSKSSRWNTAH